MFCLSQKANLHCVYVRQNHRHKVRKKFLSQCSLFSFLYICKILYGIGRHYIFANVFVLTLTKKISERRFKNRGLLQLLILYLFSPFFFPHNRSFYGLFRWLDPIFNFPRTVLFSCWIRRRDRRVSDVSRPSDYDDWIPKITKVRT